MWFLCDHVHHQRNGIIVIFIHSLLKQYYLGPDFQLRCKIRSSIQVDKKHAWSKRLKTISFYYFLYLNINLYCRLFKKDIVWKVWDERYAIWFGGIFLIWMHERLHKESTKPNKPAIVMNYQFTKTPQGFTI